MRLMWAVGLAAVWLLIDYPIGLLLFFAGAGAYWALNLAASCRQKAQIQIVQSRREGAVSTDLLDALSKYGRIMRREHLGDPLSDPLIYTDFSACQPGRERAGQQIGRIKMIAAQ